MSTSLQAIPESPIHQSPLHEADIVIPTETQEPVGGSPVETRVYTLTSCSSYAAQQTFAVVQLVSPTPIAQPSGDPSDDSSSSEETETDDNSEDASEGGEASGTDVEATASESADTEATASEPTDADNEVVEDEEVEIKESEEGGKENESGGDSEESSEEEVGDEEAHQDVEWIDNQEEVQVEEEETYTLAQIAFVRGFRPFYINGFEYYCPRSQTIPLPYGPVIALTVEATSSTGLHLLRQGIELDVGIHPAHLHTQASHSTIS